MLSHLVHESTCELRRQMLSSSDPADTQCRHVVATWAKAFATARRRGASVGDTG
jgi:hypothetical protein